MTDLNKKLSKTCPLCNLELDPLLIEEILKSNSGYCQSCGQKIELSQLEYKIDDSQKNVRDEHQTNIPQYRDLDKERYVSMSKDKQFADKTSFKRNLRNNKKNYRKTKKTNEKYYTKFSRRNQKEYRKIKRFNKKKIKNVQKNNKRKFSSLKLEFSNADIHTQNAIKRDYRKIKKSEHKKYRKEKRGIKKL